MPFEISISSTLSAMCSSGLVGGFDIINYSDGIACICNLGFSGFMEHIPYTQFFCSEAEKFET